MTRKQANKTARDMAKNNVRDYFKTEGVENFNMSISLIKSELSCAFNKYWAHYSTDEKTFKVMTLGCKILC